MKKLFILLTICTGISMAASAADSTAFYHMVSVLATPPNTITPTTDTTAGLTPSDTFLTAAVRGQVVSDTIYFTNYDKLTYMSIPITMDQLTIDSIYLPSGLTWNTNKANNTFTTSEQGVIYVTGTTWDTAGQYKLRIIVTAVTSLLTLPEIDAEQYTGLAYRVRVRNCGCATPFIDNSHADSTRVFIPFSCDTTTGPLCNVGINEISNDISQVSVAPNPFSNSASLNFVSSVEGSYSLKMTNLIGSVVSSKEVTIVHGSNEFQIDRNGLSSGIYLLSISNGSSSVTRKIIIE